MNRRNCLKILGCLLPCAIVTRMLGEKDLHGTPTPNPAYETATYEGQGLKLWQRAIQTPNLHDANDNTIAKEFEELNRKIEKIFADAKKKNWEIRDVKFYWRNILRPEGPDKFVRVLFRACDPSYPVYWRGER